uniref:Inositol polyphosphate 1-phosphatase n=1 Tax=Timema bartmani TaxID=61472 RepID=A0A7R9I0Y9_9NEOP|nr:unnamed protein product [Timema bartmani]
MRTKYPNTVDTNPVYRGSILGREKHKRKVNAVGMRYLRNVCGKTRMDRVSNEWVLKECGLKGNATNNVKEVSYDGLGMISMSSSYFLESLLKVSEKAANIARVCRQNQHLFKLLVQEKKNEEKNPRFFQDFKTLADVLIQETVKHDIGNQDWQVVVLSRFENSALVSSLNCAGYSLAEAAGAGYKLLCVADGCADAFVLLKSSTYFWDTCGPHALLRSMGGVILDCKSINCMEGNKLNKEISYTCGDLKDKSLGMSAFSNKGGFVASRDKQTLDKLVTLIAGLESYSSTPLEPHTV